MSQHLEAQRISGCILGEPSDEDRAHLEVCADCRREIEQFNQALRGLRGSIRSWSESEFAAVCQAPPKPVVRPPMRAVWSMAVVLLLSVLGMRFSLERRVVPVAPVFDDAAAELIDAELMDNVRADMGRPVPRGMEPLLALILESDNADVVLP